MLHNADQAAASFDRVDRRGAGRRRYPYMNEAVFLVVLGAFAILYAAGWLAISLPKRERREALRRDHRS
jgi:ATP-dependent DNA ligase